MPQSLRKFIGTIILLAFVMAYALLAMSIGGAVAVNLPEYGRLAFFLFAGLAWTLPAMVIIRWMQRP